MDKATQISIKKFCLLVFASILCFQMSAQTPVKCLEIESILVDACVPGSGCTSSTSPSCSCEGKNEMVRFKIGPTNISVPDLSIDWPNNSFLGISPPNATTASLVSALNSTILSCGYLIEPIGGILPAGRTILLITSTEMCTTANSFANLSDTIIVIFQNAGNFQGHFVNYSSIPGLRTTIFTQISSSCADTVVYDKSLLINQLGGYGGSSAINDGSTVEFTWPGAANYINLGCMAPFETIEADAGAGGSICPSGTISLTGTADGNYSGIIWQGGMGTFSNSDSLTTTYTAAPGESGTLTLTLGVIGFCSDTVFSLLNVTINPLPVPTISASGSTSICAGNSVTLSASGGTTYLWSTGSSASSISVSASGTYTVTASNTCGSEQDTMSVFITPLPTVTINNSTSDTLCVGDTIILWATGIGSYAWSGGSTNDSIIVTAGGTYSVAATNSCGTANDLYTVTSIAPPSPVITSGGSTTLCPGDSVSLTASGGGTYLWNTGSTGTTIFVSAAGTYTLTAMNGCGSQQDTMSIFVNPLPSVTINNSTSDSLCVGDTIILWATGIGNYTWSGGSTNDSIIVTSGGTYSVAANNSCGTANDLLTITSITPPSPVITTGGSTVLCPGDSVSLTASGGGTYLWSTGSTSTTIFVSTAGTYTLTTTNSCGSQQTTQSVSTSSFPSVILNSSDTSFCTGSSLLLWATGTGAYSWTDGSTNDSIIVTSGGTYSVSASSSCGSVTDSIIVTELPMPIASITSSGSTTICSGSSVVLTGAGGTSYLWQPTASLTSSISVSLSGTYTLTTNNSCGSDTATITVTTINPPTASITPGSSTDFCLGDSVTLNANGGGTYIWSTGETTNSITASNEGNYWVVASNICGSDTSAININIDSVMAFFTNDVYSGTYPLTVNFTNASSANASGFFWNFGDGTTSSGTSPANIFQAPGTYVVTLTVTNSLGCTDTYSITIVVLENPSELIIPNIFSPNNDGQNDLFFVTGTYIQDFECSIYDRWGLKMVNLSSITDSWDGRTSSGVLATDGTYYYIIKATGLDKKDYSAKGFLELVR